MWVLAAARIMYPHSYQPCGSRSITRSLTGTYKGCYNSGWSKILIQNLHIVESKCKKIWKDNMVLSKVPCHHLHTPFSSSSSMLQNVPGSIHTTNLNCIPIAHIMQVRQLHHPEFAHTINSPMHVGMEAIFWISCCSMFNSSLNPAPPPPQKKHTHT